MNTPSFTHRYPRVPNLGDMTAIAGQVRAGTVRAPDILVGGTPCQSFSVAGARQGLNDPRGALTLAYVELANAIDQTRHQNRRSPATLVWENVPGVLNDRSNAFGHFLGALAGEGRALQPDIDKCRLHTGEDTDHSAHIDIAHEAPRGVAFDVQFLDDPLFEDGDPGLLRSEINEDAFGHR